MRQLITNYSITGTHQITTQESFTIEQIRLIVNETQHKILCSSMQKELVTNVTNGVITLSNSTPNLISTDKITIEIDLGNSVTKQDLSESESRIIEAIEEIPEPVIPTDYAKESTLVESTETILTNLWPEASEEEIQSMFQNIVINGILYANGYIDLNNMHLPITVDENNIATFIN